MISLSLTFDDRQASMRPRVFPAENGGPVREVGIVAAASMRPRVFPAKNAKLALLLRALY